ncbi:hypothetical protein EON67_12065, partial [archaeon]
MRALPALRASFMSPVHGMVSRTCTTRLSGYLPCCPHYLPPNERLEGGRERAGAPTAAMPWPSRLKSTLPAALLALGRRPAPLPDAIREAGGPPTAFTLPRALPVDAAEPGRECAGVPMGDTG